VRRLGFFLLAFSLGSAASAGELGFVERSRDWGVEFRHTHGGSGEFYILENLGSGVVIFDFDGDGDPDLFFADGGALPGYEGLEPMGPRLFRNDGPAEGFVDVTERSGIEAGDYGIGAVAADVEGDGDLDLYTTSFGKNRLWRNRGDGTFEAADELADEGLGTSAAFADADRDGDLDLYVVSYVDFAFDKNPICGLEHKNLRSYCTPEVYEGLPDRFYLNRGDGTFEDHTRESGFGDARGKGLGVIFGDVDDDGWVDLYVANDLTPNFLFRNRGLKEDGRVRFEELAMLAGAALSDRGESEAGMGVDLGDLDGDGHLELMVTNFDVETNALYAHLGDWLFTDRRYGSQLANPSLYKVAFGVAFADFDQDGAQDVAVANGHTIHNIELWERGPGFHYRQPNQVFHNDGRGRFAEVDAGFETDRVSRGLAVGDLDLDGDLDLVITNLGEKAEVFENVSSSQGNWLQVDLSLEGANPFGIGARLELAAGGKTQVREVRTSSSYLSQNAMSVHFGLGGTERLEKLRIRWPDGGPERLIENLPADRRLRVVR